MRGASIGFNTLFWYILYGFYISGETISKITPSYGALPGSCIHNLRFLWFRIGFVKISCFVLTPFMISFKNYGENNFNADGLVNIVVCILRICGHVVGLKIRLNWLYLTMSVRIPKKAMLGFLWALNALMYCLCIWGYPDYHHHLFYNTTYFRIFSCLN